MFIIGIAGGTGSGKTTVARAIVDKLGKDYVSLIAQDSYYLDHSHLTPEQREQLNYDHPDSFDNQMLLLHLNQLRKGKSIEVPTYDFTTHTRTDKTVCVRAKPVIVVEGIMILVDDALRSAFDIRVFVDTDADVRVLRRIKRDILERGRTFGSVFQQYLATVKPMHDAFVEPSKRFADIIIPEGGHNEIAINLLTSKIERYLTDAMAAIPGD